MLRQLITATVLVVSSAITAQAGGPAFVAGSGYNQGVEGHPILWANGSLQYFTDQGDLSPILPAAQADALVAGAFAAWTGIPGAGLTVTYSGHLAEDVNGSNIVADQYGNIGAPADITSSATSTPVAIIYDSDGSDTDALLGEGAGSAADCFTNAVYGGPDNFNIAGNIAHAIVIINGVCASTSVQLPDVQYRLVRVLGRVLGLGWSQANLNVLTRKPVPTTADFAGFPVMHSADPISCVPVSVCYPDAAVPKMDDMIALTKLYPGARNGQASGRVYGIVYFTDTSVNAAQPMQGVNVVARLMVGGQPSRQYVVTSVSGFRFTGNAGNIVNGYVDANGLRYDRWGSRDPVLEGYFDLGQLIIPSGQNIAQYQLSVEALDPRWSRTVGPYAPNQVTPSGSFPPVVVTVENGSDTERDMFMLQDAVAQPHPGSGSTYLNPVKLPSGGSWGSWIAGYGSADFFQFTAQANRTASVSVMAYDESGQPTLSKLEPAIGIWQLSDQSGNPAPAATPSAFNTSVLGMTRLDAQFGATGSYRVAIADSRGDGRPDYMYRARLLYADTVSPARLGLTGGVTSLNGIGFGPGLQLSVGASSGSILSSSASHLLVAIPAGQKDGAATIRVSDTSSGAFSQMVGAVAYGALETDLLKMLQATEPATPVGAVAASPIRVRAVASDGTTPVSGATIAWSASNGLQFSACGGASSCSVLTDEAGESSTLVTPIAIGQSTITVALAPASYQTPQTQLTTVFGNSTSLDLAGVAPTRWIAQGASLSVPLTVEVLNLGLPKPNVTINFMLTKGSASLSAASASTSVSGFATVTATLANQNSDVQVSACVAPGNSPCQTFTLFSTPSSLWAVEAVSGSSQAIVSGQAFQPLILRITDGSSSANPVMGVPVTFQTTLARVPPDQGGPLGGDAMISVNAQPVLLGSSQTQVTSNQDGLVSVMPSPGNVGPCDVFITVGGGIASAKFHMENLAAIVTLSPKQSPAKAQPRRPIPNHRPADDSANAISLFAIAGDVSSGTAIVDSEASKPDLPGDVDRSNEEPQIREPSALADPVAAKDSKKAPLSHDKRSSKRRKVRRQRSPLQLPVDGRPLTSEAAAP